MIDKEIIAVLRLQRLPRIGDITAKKLITFCGSPSAIFSDKRDHLLKINGIGSWSLEGLFDERYLKEAIKEWKYIERNNVAYTYYQDEAYPSKLLHCPDAPLLLFHRGTIDIQDRLMLSVVGTRNMTAYGAAFCRELIDGLAPLNPVIVSGMAYGVDICVQKEAVVNGLQTIGCLAHGLNQMYPKIHRQYVAEIEANGGFITEFWSSSSPDRENFLRRNRIIAGLSEATLVVESAERGGSLVTADLAFHYNREVFAVPGRVSDEYSKGCNNLIKKQKAQMISSAAELIYYMGWNIDEKKSTGRQQKLFVELDKIEQKIFDFLQEQGRQELDTISMACELPVNKTPSILLNMEMKGVITPLPGKYFEVI
ncbi:MAG: DNA-processing protein DprA [Flavobacteriaceae bacterium]|nr:DNA-processing protein DprA [Flavobacteriaceae bacterium]MDH3796620.1 DNA-processing protein DprA [Flavobacteriaceae bacterium]